MAVADMVDQTVKETVTKAMSEAVMIYLTPDGKMAIKSNMGSKQETLGILLTAINVIAMKPEEVKSTIIKPNAAQVIKVNN